MFIGEEKQCSILKIDHLLIIIPVLTTGRNPLTIIGELIEIRCGTETTEASCPGTTVTKKLLF